MIYSRNGLGAGAPANNAHNLYAPFYAAYIPATRAAQTSSGVTGELANNFPGFQNEDGLYHFWDLLNEVNRPLDEQHLSGRRWGRPDQWIRTDPPPAWRCNRDRLHGRAWRGHRQAPPDVGVRLASDANNLCDLGEIGTTPRLLGNGDDLGPGRAAVRAGAAADQCNAA